MDNIDLGKLAKEKLEEAFGERMLTNLHDARPTWHQNARDRLDEAVFTAYGWPINVTGEEILKNLLALNLERAIHTTGVEETT